MITEQKHLLRSLRRSHTSTPSSSSSSSSSPSQSSSSWIHLRSVFFVVTNSSSSSPFSSDRSSLKSPWSRRRRKRALLPKHWKHLFEPDGRLSNGGIKFLKKVRSGGVDPNIRAEVWPFLLGVYDLNSTKEERDSTRNQKRKEYENLRRRCCRILRRSVANFKVNETAEDSNGGSGGFFSQDLNTIESYDISSARTSNDGDNPSDSDGPIWDPEILPSVASFGGENIELTGEDGSGASSVSLESESSEDGEDGDNVPFLSAEEFELNDLDENPVSSLPKEESGLNFSSEDFATWQRIIRVDALRANPEWIVYSPSQAAVSEAKARQHAEKVGLKDYDHLEPCMIYHATRLVSILEAYALYDPETGYCQGMSDLLSPIISVIEEDHEAFWCFVGFMKKARHNFRLDEVGIRRQLGLISKIIKCKDSHLYSHLEKLQAEDCFFLYRMVVVLFRRELTFEQTLCLWEVMWADQAAIRAGISKSAWGKMRLRAPPTDDLLLYAVAACVLQRRKLILEKYNSMDEIIRDCNNMSGNLDIWKLLDDAHDLVVTLHDKI
ncbi:rab GTPase-activating protein 22-like [Amaranthus tricolor]|uniref:rab GTPase-activating protein 22-like n=1 Tax=Amaranthus tricolor TaxID=29722 RepID=UPI00258B8DA2|nr:rab GTPase-activating protein 22-like [Amaranthus tricolor]